MIQIDMIAEDTGYPGTFEAEKIWVADAEFYDNLGNKDIPEADREKVTRTEPAVWAQTFCNGYRQETMLASFDTPQAALAVYNDIMTAIKRGDTLYQFRQEGEGLGKSTTSGSSAEDRSKREADNTIGVPQII